MGQGIYMCLLYFYCICAYRRQNQKYFPEITVKNQQDIYSSYLSLIKREESSVELDRLSDSSIDMQKAFEFRNRIKEGDERTTVVVDLGGSSLKLSFIKWSCVGQDREQIFEIIRNERYEFEVENQIEPLDSYLWSDWIVKKLKIFLSEIQSETPTVKIPSTAALSFSFKIKQSTLSSAEFVEYHKHWWFLPVELGSKDIVKEINDSLARENIDLRVNCVVNDVIATFMSGVAQGMNNFASVIIGTGTNAGYLINCNGRWRLVNSEWASFEIKDLITVDECSQKCRVDRGTGNTYLELEVLTAGMKMDEIIRERIRQFKEFPEADVSALSTRKIYEIYNRLARLDMSKTTNDVTRFEYLVFRVFKAFKTRAYRILAPMLLAAVKDFDRFSVITNGTIVGMPYDSHVLRYELLRAIENVLPTKKHLVDVYYEENGSLIGAAFTSIVFSDDIGNVR